MRSLRHLLFASFLGLAGCSHGGSGVAVHNLGLAADWFIGDDELYGILERESADANGDGDGDDVLVHVYDHESGQFNETGLAFGDSNDPLQVADLVVAGELVSFPVREASQGNTDLNGDGDALDAVLHVYDQRTGVTTNTGLALGSFPAVIALERVVFDVSEADQGNVDLDGNGVLRGSVLHVYDATTHVTTNVEREATSPVRVHDLLCAFLTSELSLGSLNGDGDALDTRVFAVLDALTGDVTTIPLAVLETPLATATGDWYALVSESDQGLDLDADGDLQDGVWHRVGADLQTIEPLGLPAIGWSDPLSDGRFTALLAQEIDGIDHNGDGTVLGTFVAVHDSTTGRIFEPMLAVGSTSSVALLPGRRLMVLVSEAGQGADLNGDGDRNEDVLHVVDLVHETTVNLGIDGGRLRPVPGSVVVVRGEGDSAHDWNGDEDDLDPVLFVWDASTDTLVNTRRAIDSGVFSSTTSSFLFLSDETQDDRDANADGDLDDQVFVAYELGPRRAIDLGLAGGAQIGGVTHGGAQLFLVSELGESDLNGDGDRVDDVLHVRE